MIKASELRRGDLITCEANDDGSPVISKVRQIFENSIEWEDEEGYMFRSQLNFSNPIPLTEEWLERMGFQFSHYTYVWYFGTFCLMQSHFVPAVWVGHRFHLIGNPLQHVHQLQNLYFALTGEELTIKQ